MKGNMRLMNLMLGMRQVRLAEDQLERILEHRFPPGSSVEWRRGPHDKVYRGVVLSPNGHERLLVKNSETGKSFFISTYDVLCSDRDLAAKLHE